MRRETAVQETILFDCDSLASDALPWIGRVVSERSSCARSVRTRMFPSLQEALRTLESMHPGSPLVLISRHHPAEERAPHSYFGQRWGLEPRELLRAMIDEGTARIPERLEPTAATTDSMRARCMSCKELLLTVPSCADTTWLSWALDKMGSDETSAWACLDALDASARGATVVHMRFGDAPAEPAGRGALMHHAGSNPLCDGFHARVVARALWASPSPAFAACFGMPCVREGRAMHGLDLLAPRAAVTVSAERDLLMGELAESRTVMHRICVPPGCATPAGACAHLEFILAGPIEIMRSEGMRTADAMRRWRVTIEHPDPCFEGTYSGCGLPEDAWPLQFGCARVDAERYPSLRRSAAAWLADATGRSPSSIPHFEPPLAVRLLRRAVLPEIASRIAFPDCGHDERHAYVISHLALLIAVLEDIPPLAPSIAGALHDIGRTDDALDPQHPAIGAEIARRIVPALRSAALTPRACAAVASAIAAHSDEAPSPCAVSAALRDADRLPLAWERGYDARFFSTGAGHSLAKAGPVGTERLFRQRFGECLFNTDGFSDRAHASR